jgi:integrase
MARQSLNLVKQRVKSTKGIYEYWCLRWFGSDGKFHGKNIGRVDELSKRQAEKIRTQKAIELAEHPGRRNASKSCTLSQFLELYLQSRKSEFTSGTYTIYEQTRKYLLGYFGDAIRLDQITRADARLFKSELASGRLKTVNKKQCNPRPATVEIHIRNCRTIFNQAVDDDVLLYNPFDRLSVAVKIERDWHYVSCEEFNKMVDAALPKIRMLLALCRLAALRRGEALDLHWTDIDFEHNRLTVIAKEDWQPKDKDKRIIPICPELQRVLLDAFNAAVPGQVKIIDGVIVKNLWRDINVLCRRAEVEPYKKPLHTLRKSCILDWAGKFPAHVVKEWAGHSSMDTTDKYYLQVPKSEYDRAATNSFWEKVTQEVTQNGVFDQNQAQKEKPESLQVPDNKRDMKKAGERIRTVDVQLGKLAFYH